MSSSEEQRIGSESGCAKKKKKVSALATGVCRELRKGNFIAHKASASTEYDARIRVIEEPGNLHQPKCLEADPYYCVYCVRSTRRAFRIGVPTIRLGG